MVETMFSDVKLPRESKVRVMEPSFRMTLVGLEKKIREVLATRPEELKLAMSDIRIIENELHLNADNCKFLTNLSLSS